jgi:dephospho-CoA kinase
MLLVGLTGSIASGKSTVAAMLAARRAWVVDADRIGHALQEPGTACHRQIVEAFGSDILEADGRIDRGRLGARVFADPEARRRLEAIMHPALWVACREEARRAEAAGAPFCVVDAALILEAGQRHRFDVIVVVTAPEEVQIRRLTEQRGLSEAEARLRLRSQWSSQAKAAEADILIDNGGELAATAVQVDRLLELLRARAQGA